MEHILRPRFPISDRPFGVAVYRVGDEHDYYITDNDENMIALVSSNLGDELNKGHACLLAASSDMRVVVSQFAIWAISNPQLVDQDQHLQRIRDSALACLVRSNGHDEEMFSEYEEEQDEEAE